MSRPLILSNGELHVGINKHGLVHDFYYPYVGLENHSSGPHTRHRVGVWVDGAMHWLDEDGWEVTFEYQSEALVGITRATHEMIGIVLDFVDTVDATMSAFVRRITVTNLRDETRDVRLFMHQAFVIGDGRSNTDTAQYLPDSDALLHYRGRRAFVVSGRCDDAPFDQHTVGIFGIEGREGTYRDADDGELSNCHVDHGRVDSTMRFKMELPSGSSKQVRYWIAAGTSLREALYVHKYVSEKGVDHCIESTAAYWREWLAPARRVADTIDLHFRDDFLRSLLVIKAHIDKRGAIMASTDTAMLNYSRDAYAYCWPRDGAYVIWPLIRLGYKDEALRFFEFVKRGLHPSGYVMHKYRADGALGSSWHPYVHGDQAGPPIQTDETASVLFVFAQLYELQKDDKVLKDFYEPLVCPMADFLAEYIDETTSLPRPSYDLWEEVYLTTTYTTAVTYGALLAAAELAEVMNDADNAVKWRTVAEDMAQAAKKYLYSDERQAFRKGILAADESVTYDDRLDSSSLYGVSMYGLFPLESREVKTTVATLEVTFGISKEMPGAPRYEHDAYHRTSADSMGNWWIITSLWIAQYYGFVLQPERVVAILAWVQEHSSSSGMLPEQIDPTSGSFVSVAPLAWSHAEFVSTLLDTAQQ